MTIEELIAELKRVDERENFPYIMRLCGEAAEALERLNGK